MKYAMLWLDACSIMNWWWIWWIGDVMMNVSNMKYDEYDEWWCVLTSRGRILCCVAHHAFIAFVGHVVQWSFAGYLSSDVRTLWFSDGLNPIVWIEYNLWSAPVPSENRSYWWGSLEITMTKPSVKFWYHMHESNDVALHYLWHCTIIGLSDVFDWFLGVWCFVCFKWCIWLILGLWCFDVVIGEWCYAIDMMMEWRCEYEL